MISACGVKAHDGVLTRYQLAINWLAKCRFNGIEDVPCAPIRRAGHRGLIVTPCKGNVCARPWTNNPWQVSAGYRTVSEWQTGRGNASGQRRLGRSRQDSEQYGSSNEKGGRKAPFYCAVSLRHGSTSASRRSCCSRKRSRRSCCLTNCRQSYSSRTSRRSWTCC
jgi:hypothetical protein